MGKKIITVDLNFPNESHTIVNEPVDEYTAIKEEVDIEPVPELTQPKPKRKPVSKKVVNEPVVETISEPVVEQIVEPIIEPVIEPVIEQPKPKEPIREEAQKVKCHHCNKEMSMKSLKYSHSRNCLGLKKTIEKVSNEKVSQKVEVRPQSAPPSSPITPVRMKTEQENPRAVRMNALKERYNNLVKNAFN
jgi:hypothetical protein